MSSLSDPSVSALLGAPNFATVSTINQDGSILSAVAWISYENGVLAVNSAEGRQWPSNLERDSRITVLVYKHDNAYEYVEVRGTASGTRDDADDHINRLAKAYIDKDEYPFRAEGEVRIKYVIDPQVVRYQKQ